MQSTYYLNVKEYLSCIHCISPANGMLLQILDHLKLICRFTDFICLYTNVLEF